MKRWFTLFLAAFFGLAAAPARAANTDVQLVLADQVVRPGDTVMVGFHLHMAPDWHTYWRNPGDAGIPTTIRWDLPQGVTAGEIQWRVPDKLLEATSTTYIYSNDVVLLAPLKISDDVPPGSLQLKAKVSWLECKTLCLPGSTNVEVTLTIGPQAQSSPDAALIEAWEKKLPVSGANLSGHAWWEKVATGDTRPLILEWNSSTATSEADFYPYGSEQFAVQPATERIPVDAPKIELRKQVKKFEGDWPTNISGLLIQKSGTNLFAYKVTLPIAASGPRVAGTTEATQTTASTGANVPASPTLSLWEMLLYAFIGGLILNIMPCVLPVIALKILGFVGEARSDPRHVRQLGLIYTLGVLFSFLVLALMVVAV
ncbi:MAG TPA: protein-disulfide reductase DsbD domain-containing protein, partial [Verrucomicrobiae bacterium]|nr:protein-disulfide reductase DsbD domain-containing protein [Verrucomicrobiae bacterium]